MRRPENSSMKSKTKNVVKPEGYLTVHINYDGEQYTLKGAAEDYERDFSEIVDFLLHLVLDKECYKFSIDDEARDEFSQTQEGILEKIIKINDKINLSKFKISQETLDVINEEIEFRKRKR